MMTGFVLGKFMPLHRGHEALLRFARASVDRLVVVVDNIPDAWVSAERRCRWIADTVPDATVIHLPQPLPQDPSHHPDFWALWREGLKAVLPWPVDIVFASEHYGQRLAAELGARFMPFDIPRAAVPVSATMIRADPGAHWPMLSAAARRDYTLRVCIFGPESTGKSTLTQALAAQYQTVGVREYARDLIEAKGELTADDMPLIARGQQALVRLALPKANRVVFSDTDALSTTVWQRWLYGAPHAGIEALARADYADLYLLTRPDLPWRADSVRFFPDQGQAFFDDCAATLAAHGRDVAIVGGQGDERLRCATAAVDQALDRFFARIGGN